MKIVSFFAGCGGLDLGFEKAGFQVIWANDSDSTVRDTYVRNHPNTKFVLADICQINPEEIPDCDGFIGGPPCQAWSVAGRQNGLEDKRGQLFLKYIDMIEMKKPKFFLIENVKGLLSNSFRYVFIMFLDRLDKAGYDVKWDLLDAVNYNIPQNRERVFFVGFRKDLRIDYKFPVTVSNKSITLEQAIGDIKEKPVEYTKNMKTSFNQLRPNHDVLTSTFGAYYCHGNRRKGWHQPSFTIHATSDNIPLHPSSPKMIFFKHGKWEFQKDKMQEYRRLSVRECARIQTFPDNFLFEGADIKNQYKMIGNAVPPRLGYLLAKSIFSVMLNLQHTPISIIENELTTDACTLVGYFKDAEHKRLILQNGLYYVRFDGRLGSMFKQDSTVIPKYLLLHHKNEAEFYELNNEKPTLTEASYLASLGFKLSGKIYLVFYLKDKKAIEMGKPRYDSRNYFPFFAKLKDLLD